MQNAQFEQKPVFIDVGKRPDSRTGQWDNQDKVTKAKGKRIKKLTADNLLLTTAIIFATLSAPLCVSLCYSRKTAKGEYT